MIDHIDFRFRGKRYRLEPIGVAALGLILLVVFVMTITVLRFSKSENSRPDLEVSVPDEGPEEPYDATQGVLDKKKYDGTVLEETPDGGADYLHGTLFLGDSNTARFLTVTNPDTSETFSTIENTIGVVGLGVDGIGYFPCMDFSTGRFTMPQSVAILQPERVIITMGTNNLSGTSTETEDFTSRYADGIRQIQKAYPSEDVIVNAIPQISRHCNYVNVKMVQIDAYNALR